jgi:small subunit ribosomal protein S6
MVKKYELTCLLDSQLGDDGFESMVTKLESLLQKAGAEVVNIDRWGLRKLAFTSVSLKRRQQAYYVLYQFTAPAGTFDGVEEEIKLDEAILRYLLVGITGEFIRVPQLAPDTVYIQTREDRGFRGRGRPGSGPGGPGGPGGRFDRGAEGRPERPPAAAGEEPKTESAAADQPAEQAAAVETVATDAPAGESAEGASEG